MKFVSTETNVIVSFDKLGTRTALSMCVCACNTSSIFINPGF